GPRRDRGSRERPGGPRAIPRRAPAGGDPRRRRRRPKGGRGARLATARRPRERRRASRALERRGGMSATRPRRLIAYAHERGGPASRFRIEQFVAPLERAGWSVSLRTQRPARPWESPYRGEIARWIHR